MKVKTLIKKFQKLQEKHGNVDVFLGDETDIWFVKREYTENMSEAFQQNYDQTELIVIS